MDVKHFNSFKLFQIDELETNFINERESFAKTQLELREMMRELTED